MGVEEKRVEYLVVDTSAFIQNAPLQEVAENIVTCQEVVDEITSKRQLRRLVVLPYELTIKEAFPENVKIITEFAKKTGDYPSLSATDIKVMALTYQLEKEKVGVAHLRTEPQKSSVVLNNPTAGNMLPDVTGFFLPGHKKVGSVSENSDDKELVESSTVEERPKEAEGSLKEAEQNLEEVKEDQHISEENIQEAEQNSEEIEKVVENLEEIEEKPEEILAKKLGNLQVEVQIEDKEMDNILAPVQHLTEEEEEEEASDDDDDEDEGWITPSNVKQAKKQIKSDLMEDKHVKVACMTTDFAMQNVLRQMDLNVAALDGRMIKQLRTFVLRCYACFKTTSMMDKQFCPKCGNNTLKKVAVSLDENGKMQVHINSRKPLTARGKKFSLPRIQGGKHSNNPILVADQPMPDNRPTRLAKMKNNPLDDDYIAGFSPFVMRDVNSKSALLRTGHEVKYWMRKNPNEARRRRK